MSELLTSASPLGILASVTCVVVAGVFLRIALLGSRDIGLEASSVPFARWEAGLIAVMALLAALVPLKLHPVIPKAVIALMLLSFGIGLASSSGFLKRAQHDDQCS